MDVRADDTRLGPDGAARATPRQADAASGPIVYSHVGAAHADTAETPIVGYEKASGTRSSRLLRAAVIVVAIAVVGAGVALALVETGVIDKTTSSSPPPPVTHATTVSKGPLATQTSTGPGTAHYSVGVAAYGVTVATGPHRSWVSIGVVGQRPIYEGIMQAGMLQHEVLLGPSQVNVGAGGTTVTISSNRRTTTLTPPSAPFSYTFTPG
jgi:hypothetical protein